MQDTIESPAFQFSAPVFRVGDKELMGRGFYFANSGDDTFQFCFGMGEVGPIVNVPAGAKVRVRIRPDEFPSVFFRTADGMFKGSLARRKDGAFIVVEVSAANLKRDRA